MKKSSLRAATALQALALMGAGITTAFISAVPAAAQDYTSGGITGVVRGATGASVGGATVTVRSEALGFERTVTSGPDGRFSFSALPAGDYDVIVQSAGNPNYRADDVRVEAGRTSQLNVDLTPAAGDVQAGTAGGGEIVVVGRRVQTFEGTETGLNVDVEELTQTVPVGRNLTSVILLAPSTSRGDSAFGNLASIGGASVAENAYYVNGLNTTNFDNYLGSAAVPFDFYKSVDIKAGGYPAEFGRATGGIISATTKRGTNNWEGALHVSWAPEGILGLELREDGRNLLNCTDVDNTDVDPVTPGVQNDRTTQVIECENLTNRNEDYRDELTAVIELGGPIIRDRLFVYGLVELRDIEYQTVNRISETAFRYKTQDPFWGLKVDLIPIDNHHLEFTVFDTRNTLTRTDIAYSEDDEGNGVFGLGTSETEFRGGGVNWVGKYTGRLTDFFTISGAYGRMRDRFDVVGTVGGAGEPYVNNAAGATVFGVPNGGFFTNQRVASTAFPYTTERRFYRADADLLVSFFGEHHFRAGFDVEKNTLSESTVRSGGSSLLAGGYITPTAYNANLGGAGFAYIFREIRPGGPVVELNYFNAGGSFKAQNDAIYLQDEWRVNDRLTVNAGVRRDNFELKNPAGVTFAVSKDNWAPRIGLTYDVWPDERGRIKAFYGEYFLPFASNTAFRQASSELFFRQRFLVTGIDGNGVPILGAQITDDPNYVAQCPFELTPGGGTAFCNVTGDGDVPDTRSLISQNLEATKEAEYILGYEHKFGDWRTGINFIRRELKQTAEDSAIDAAVNAYCNANGNPVPTGAVVGAPGSIYDNECNRPIADADPVTAGAQPGFTPIFTGFHQYVIMNPGNDLVVYIPEFDETITVSADDLGYPRAKRTYTALEFMFDRPYDGVWSLGGSYTRSWSKGNSEGFVQSDFGQDDAGITQDFDQPGFSDHAYGYLPSHRAHRFKLYGAYTLPMGRPGGGLTLGTNISLESPRPLSCFGYHPTDRFAQAYGAASRYCGGEPSPRGTAQKSSWIFDQDVKLAYRMPITQSTTVQFRMDVFNIWNRRGVQQRNEVGELTPVFEPAATRDFVGQIRSHIPNPNFGQPTLYQSPRSVRLGLDVFFGGEPAPVLALAPPPPPPPPPPAAPATQTCPDGTVILATDACPAPPPPPPPPPPEPERG